MALTRERWQTNELLFCAAPSNTDTTTVLPTPQKVPVNVWPTVAEARNVCDAAEEFAAHVEGTIIP